MKDKTIKKSKQTLKIQLYEVLIRELVIIITAAGIKFPPHVVQVLEVLFPNYKDMDSAQSVKEHRCPYCKFKNKCTTSMYRFQPEGCKDKFRKSILYFWKKI